MIDDAENAQILHKAPDKMAIELAMTRRMRVRPATYGELGGVATCAGGDERDADRYLQKLRRKGWATFQRTGGRIWWTLTDEGRTQTRPLFPAAPTGAGPMTAAELIATMEGASGPSRELDASVHQVVVGLRQYESIMWELGEPYLRYFPGPPGPEYSQLPRYTSSLDAALTLVPEGWEWCAYGAGGADVWWPEGLHAQQMTYAATPALALCIAALKARGETT